MNAVGAHRPKTERPPYSRNRAHRMNPEASTLASPAQWETGAHSQRNESGNQYERGEQYYILMASFYCSFAVASVAVMLSSLMLLLIARLIRDGSVFLLLAANLCVADIGVALATLALHAFRYLQRTAADSQLEQRQAEAKDWQCAASVAVQLWDVATYENLFTIFLMTLSQFASIRWPHRSQKLVSTAAVLAAIALTWLLSAGIGLTRMTFVMAANVTEARGESVGGGATYCDRERSYSNLTIANDLHKEALFAVSTATMLFVYVTVFLAYAYIFRHVWARTLHRGGHPKSDEGVGTRVRLMRRTMVTILLLLGSFSVLWLPMVIYSALSSMGVVRRGHLGKDALQTLRVALATLVSMAGIVDPVLYGVRLPEVRKAIQKYAPRSAACIPKRPTESSSNAASKTDARPSPKLATRQL